MFDLSTYKKMVTDFESVMIDKNREIFSLNNSEKKLKAENEDLKLRISSLDKLVKRLINNLDNAELLISSTDEKYNINESENYMKHKVNNNP